PSGKVTITSSTSPGPADRSAGSSTNRALHCSRTGQRRAGVNGSSSTARTAHTRSASRPRAALAYCPSRSPPIDLTGYRQISATLPATLIASSSLRERTPPNVLATEEGGGSARAGIASQARETSPMSDAPPNELQNTKDLPEEAFRTI